MPRRRATPIRLLERLNLFGLDHLDPVVLAALADERPMLLIGPHGSAKSELLNRLADALGLDHRHYNASLISFDDLLGFPVPNAALDGLTYLRTPGDLWGAESVFLDEISRCRPENQNKLFSVIHEKRVQGLPLTRLRYRWSAMNPPLTGEEEAGEEVYEGSLPLDPALADRFAYILALPGLEGLDGKARRRLILEGGEAPAAWPELAALVGEARAHAAAFGAGDRDWTARYVDELVAPLREAGLAISARRAVALARGVASVHGACLALGLDGGRELAALLTLKWGLPQRAQGRGIGERKLAAIHRLAVQAAGEAEDDPRRAIRREPDPVKRAAAGIAAYPAVGRLEVSTLVADAFASLTPPRRQVLALSMAPAVLRRGCVNVPTLELLTEPLERLRRFTAASSHQLAVPIARAPEVSRTLGRIAALPQGDAHQVQLGNLLLAMVAGGGDGIDPEVLAGLDREWRPLFAEGGP